jgi:hypothetical protein
VRCIHGQQVSLSGHDCGVAVRQQRCQLGLVHDIRLAAEDLDYRAPHRLDLFAAQPWAASCEFFQSARRSKHFLDSVGGGAWPLLPSQQHGHFPRIGRDDGVSEDMAEGSSDAID